MAGLFLDASVQFVLFSFFIEKVVIGQVSLLLLDLSFYFVPVPLHLETGAGVVGFVRVHNNVF
jgi:hypothetical protein